MDIVSALINSDSYIVFKTRRMAYYRDDWVVYERLPGYKKTKVLVKTRSQETAVKFLLGLEERDKDFTSL